MNKTNHTPKDKPTLAIIGAGLAGLTAAFRLFQNGYSVDLYEARNRVGGRVLSVLMENSLGNRTITELGAHNITDGGEAVNLLRLIKNFGLEVETNEIEVSALIHDKGQYLNFQTHLSKFLQEQKDIDQHIDTLALGASSIEDLLNKIFANYSSLRLAFATRMTAYEGIDVKYQSLYHNLETFQYMLKGGGAPSHEVHHQQKNHIIFKSIKGGNALLPLKLAESLDKQLHLNKQLYQVRENNNKVELLFKDGSSGLYDLLIMAVPASVYHNIDFAHTLLSKDRWFRMQQVKYGTNCKVVFPCFLPLKSHYNFIITSQQIAFFNNARTALTFYLNHPLNSLSTEIQIVNKHYKFDDNLPKNTPLTAQDQHYLTYNKPVTHSWFDDPYSRGSYSGYSTLLSRELDQNIIYRGTPFKELFQPSKDRVFFIGEHTTLLEYIGTMEAAVESAERLVECIVHNRFSLE